MRIETDYLAIGAGATGLAFADVLARESDAEILVVDRQDAPGGHWPHAYPFVSLHSPSAFYGVHSLPLGTDRIDTTGPNAGLYERASKPEILAYFADVVSRLEQTGRVRVLLGHEHLGSQSADGERLRELSSGEVHEVRVRRAVVDARYLEASVPATHTPSFQVAADAFFTPIGGLPEHAEAATSYAVLGAGKTAVDACLWLLEQGVDPERIQWVRPQDAWFHDRAGFQPLELVVSIMEGLALDAEAGAQATDAQDLAARLEDRGRLVRVDPTALTTMYRGGMLSDHELTELRRLPEGVRLGRVLRVDRDRLVLERGELATGPAVLAVDCTAQGLRVAPPVPVFSPGRIVLQQVRHNSPPFNAGLIAYVEAHRDDDAEKNRLCPPNPYAATIDDYPGMLARTWRTEGQWLREPDLSAWVGGTRTNLLRAFPEHLGEPRAQAAVTAYLAHVGAAIENLERISRTAT